MDMSRDTRIPISEVLEELKEKAEKAGDAAKRSDGEEAVFYRGMAAGIRGVAEDLENEHVYGDDYERP